MNTPFDVAVAVRRPPHSFGSGDPTENKEFATTDATSTAEQDILGEVRFSYVVMRFDADAYICFGPTGMFACTADCWPVKAGEIWEWMLVGRDDRYCRVLRAGATNVNVDWYLSDRLAINTGE